ncbi:MAG: nuclear transport factor 2 family protein [Pseudomonadota bacterium]|nr:nuclear transport factor 2 family protein [Pseudomonadota bacterium]
MSNLLQPNTAKALATWHEMIATENTELLADLLHENVVFRSPMAHRAYSGSLAVGLILKTVITIFQDFTYHREFVTADGLQVVLEFSAVVDGKSLKGIDMIEFDQDGKIIDFEVMIRPFNALVALGKEMGARVGQLLEPHKVD